MRLSALLILAALLGRPSSFAAAYYLDPAGGSLSNPGTVNAPWPALETVAGAGKIFGAGDELILRPGFHGFPTIRGHNSGQVIIRADGNGDARIGKLLVTSASRWTIRGLKISPSFAPTFTRQTMIDTYASASEIVIEHCQIMTVADSTGWSATDWDQTACNGILARGPNVTLRNNHFLNVNFGISITGVSNVISGNVVENFSGDGLRGLGDHGIFEHNVIKNCYDVNANHDDGFQSWSTDAGGTVGRGVVRGIVIRGNTFLNHEDPAHPLRGALQGIGCFDGFFEDWVIENNVVITDHWHGITLLGARNCRIVNNTVVDLNTTSPGPPWIQIGNHKDGSASTGNLVRNNLTTDLNITAGSATVDHNLEFSNPALHFRNYAARDLRLIATSTAIDQGSPNLAPTSDHAGLPRPLDGLNDGTSEPDIGAFEFAHPVRDSDGDGMSDADEGVCGTSPLEASDIFRIRCDLVSAGLALSWPSLRGREYGLHVSAEPDFTDGAYYSFSGTGGVIQYTNVTTSGSGFFKLEVSE